MMPQLSVIIPVKDDTVRLLNCLEALENQTASRDIFEVLVIDNNSNPPVAESITSSDKIIVRLFRESRPSGFAARNLGVENARGDIFVFTDADTIPDPDWLKNGMECLKMNADAAFAGGKVEIVMSEKPNAVEFFEYFYGFNQEEYIRKNNFSVTANMFTTKEIFLKTGGFNNELKSGGDKEWGQKAVRFGKGVYCKKAIVNHPSRKDWSELKTKIERTLGGYFQINSTNKVSKLSMLPEVIGDMFPIRQFFNLFFIKKGSFVWKIKAFYIVIRLKWYRSFLKLKFIISRH